MSKPTPLKADRGIRMCMNLRAATSDDEAFLFELYCGTRADEVAAWDWPRNQIDNFLRLQFTAQRRMQQERFPAADHKIVCCGGRDIGRLIVSWEDLYCCLVDISLLPEFRNGGRGTELIRALLKEAAESKLPVRLHVLIASAAVRLYVRLGFVAQGDDGVYLQMEAFPDDHAADVGDQA